MKIWKHPNTPRLATVPQRIRTINTRQIATAWPAKRKEKTTLPIYQTQEYRRWRAAVIKRCLNRCVHCGAPGSRNKLYADHVVEIADGGAPFDVHNGQSLCSPCHGRKTASAKFQRGLGSP